MRALPILFLKSHDCLMGSACFGVEKKKCCIFVPKLRFCSRGADYFWILWESSPQEPNQKSIINPFFFVWQIVTIEWICLKTQSKLSKLHLAARGHPERVGVLVWLEFLMRSVRRRSPWSKLTVSWEGLTLSSFWERDILRIIFLSIVVFEFHKSNFCNFCIFVVLLQPLRQHS